MANDTTITVRGWAGADPVVYQNKDTETSVDAHTSAATINVGVTPRTFSRNTQQFEDGETTWYSVRCYGALAHNVGLSVHKGAPLLVRGKFVTKQYTDKQGVPRTSQQIIADSIGIDLNSMVATYSKAFSQSSGTADRALKNEGWKRIDSLPINNLDKCRAGSKEKVCSEGDASSQSDADCVEGDECSSKTESVDKKRGKL